MLNCCQLTATVTREDALRYTPAGIAILQFWLCHQSQQVHCGITRKVECNIQAVLVGKTAEEQTGKLMGQQIEVNGFLVKRNLSNERLVLHVQRFKLI